MRPVSQIGFDLWSKTYNKRQKLRVFLPQNRLKKERETLALQIHQGELLIFSAENLFRIFFSSNPTHFCFIICKFKGINLSICLKNED